MRFQARRYVHDQGAAGAIVHRAVIDAVTVDGSADADVVDVRGEHDEFILESGIGASELGNDVGGFEGLGENDRIGFERASQGEVRKWLAVFAQSSDFREGVAGTSKELFRGGGIEGNAEFEAGGFIELSIGEAHGGGIAIYGNSGPPNGPGRDRKGVR